MAEFSHGPVSMKAVNVVLADDGKTALLNNKGTVRFSHAATQIRIKCDNGDVHDCCSQRGVIEAPNGVMVLPYFQRDETWYVILIEQFRIALPGKTLEPAGGEADEKDPQFAMVRELEEEAHMTVRAEDIEVVFTVYIQPSMMRTTASGGIIKIEDSQLPNELVAGEWQFGEYTVVTVQPLVELLKARDSGSWLVDCETWLLLDAVAKKVGLLIKSY